MAVITYFALKLPVFVTIDKMISAKRYYKEDYIQNVSIELFLTGNYREKKISAKRME